MPLGDYPSTIRLGIADPEQPLTRVAAREAQAGESVDAARVHLGLIVMSSTLALALIVEELQGRALFEASHAGVAALFLDILIINNINIVIVIITSLPLDYISIPHVAHGQGSAHPDLGHTIAAARLDLVDVEDDDSAGRVDLLELHTLVKEGLELGAVALDDAASAEQPHDAGAGPERAEHERGAPVLVQVRYGLAARPGAVHVRALIRPEHCQVCRRVALGRHIDVLPVRRRRRYEEDRLCEGPSPEVVGKRGEEGHHFFLLSIVSFFLSPVFFCAIQLCVQCDAEDSKEKAKQMLIREGKEDSRVVGLVTQREDRITERGNWPANKK